MVVRGRRLYRGDRGELTHFSLKSIFILFLLNYVGMVVFHAISLPPSGVLILCDVMSISPVCENKIPKYH